MFKLLLVLFLCHLAAMVLIGWLAPELLPDHASWTVRAFAG
jgi:hypothetical protein